MAVKRAKRPRQASFGKKEEQAAKSGKRTLLFLVLFTLLPVSFFGWRELYMAFLERNRPAINVDNLGGGVGASEHKITINIADNESGLKEVVIMSKQDNVTKQLFRRNYTDPVKVTADTIELTLGPDNNFTEGTVQLLIYAADRSLWKNAYQAAIGMNVDYTKPKIELLTIDHSITPGGSAIAIYKVEEKNEVFSGITIGEWLFPGFPASGLDEAFQGAPNVHFTLFPVPLDFDELRHTVSIIARDQVGNDESQPLLVDFKPARYMQKENIVNDELITIKIRELLEKYDQYTGQIRDYNELETSDQGRVEMFRLVNENYRQFAEETLAPIFKRPKARKIWKEAFIRQGDSQTAIPFAALLNHKYKNLDAGETIYPGVALGVPVDTLVTAGNNGRIIFADVLGVYGKTVILDHGFGLTSLYGNLSGFRGLEGTEMFSGEVVGELGDEGVSAPGTLHFEIRLHGMPVQPQQWWDPIWVEKNITRKINRVKRRLGLLSGRGF